MIDIENKAYKPTVKELCEFVRNSLFDALCGYMDSEYKAVQSVEYSGDKVLLGWNLKFKKAGRTLCTVYPRNEHFLMLLVVGRKEKETVKAFLPTFSDEFKEIYDNTQEGMGQRWLLLDFSAHTRVYDDALSVVRIRRESK